MLHTSLYPAWPYCIFHLQSKLHKILPRDSLQRNTLPTAHAHILECTFCTLMTCAQSLPTSKEHPERVASVASRAARPLGSRPLLPEAPAQPGVSTAQHQSHYHCHLLPPLWLQVLPSWQYCCESSWIAWIPTHCSGTNCQHLVATVTCDKSRSNKICLF